MSLACAVCDEPFEEADLNLSDEGLGSYPCCDTCLTTGRHDRWREQAIAALTGCQIVFVSKGNLADDYRTLCIWQRHSSRLDDGICPNGCARLTETNETSASCPVCGFQYQKF